MNMLYDALASLINPSPHLLHLQYRLDSFRFCFDLVRFQNMHMCS
jgi:hypothetical protein